MKLTNDQQKGQELMEGLISKSWKDEAFKKELIASPVATIERFTGKTSRLPEGVSVVVEDQTNSGVVYLNIPAKPDFSNMELTDEQLELVAGGESVVAGLVCLGAGILIGYMINH